MNKRLEKFLQKAPEKIITWQDSYTPARGWLVINSLRHGAAGGGTRMRAGCTLQEVIDLAKTMEIKFTVSGPDIGGAKSGIDFAYSNELEKIDVLRRWFAYIQRELQTCYGTGGDQNVDQNDVVVPLLGELGIRHPQEGIVRGYYGYLSQNEQKKILDQLYTGVRMPITSDSFLSRHGFTIGDIATGFGVVEAVKFFFERSQDSLRGKRVVIEGIGSVGGAAAYFFIKESAKVVGIIDKDHELFDYKGIEVPTLLPQRVSKIALPASYSGVRKRNVTLPDSAFDVFIPAATSATLSEGRLKQLQERGVSVIACGANNPFTSDVTFDMADAAFSVLPDFIANSGMARVFAYLMTPDCVLDERAVLDDITLCMKNGLGGVFKNGASLNRIAESAYEVAISNLGL